MQFLANLFRKRQFFSYSSSSVSTLLTYLLSYLIYPCHPPTQITSLNRQTPSKTNQNYPNEQKPINNSDNSIKPFLAAPPQASTGNKGGPLPPTLTEHSVLFCWHLCTFFSISRFSAYLKLDQCWTNRADLTLTLCFF